MATLRSEPPLLVNGWQIFAHPLFSDQLDRLVAAVESDKRKKPSEYRSGANAKLLAAIFKLAFVTIPEDPSRPEYRHGSTLGTEYRHWFRAKFGNGRFRLFFRYNSAAKIVILAWVNDAGTLRTYGSRKDAYAVFASMLDSGNPPDDWDARLRDARSAGDAIRKLRSE